MDPIVTERLTLRPVTPDDFRVLHALYADAETMRFVTGYARTPEQTRARLEKDLEHHRTFGFGLCIAEFTSTGEAIGRCGLAPHPTDAGLEGELAWMFARPWRGKGLATETGEALIRLGCDLGLVRLFATSDPENAPSIRVMEKLGMRRVATSATEVVYEVGPDGAP